MIKFTLKVVVIAALVHFTLNGAFGLAEAALELKTHLINAKGGF